MVLDGYKKMTIYADYENVNFLDKLHLQYIQFLNKKQSIFYNTF